MSEYELFARTYDLEFGTLSEDIPFWVELAKEAGGPALELAAGTGRVAIKVARAGVPVTALDLSPGMLAHLRRKFAAEPEPAPLDRRGRHARRRPTARGPFGLVYVPARAFQALLTIEDQLAAMRNAKRHLSPGGLFAGDLFFPDVALLAQKPRPWAPGGEFVDPATGRRCLVSESTVYDLKAQTLVARFRVEEIGADGTVLRTEIRDLSLAWIWPRELEHLLARAGFTLERLYGDFRKTPFAEGGGEMIFVARA